MKIATISGTLAKLALLCIGFVTSSAQTPVHTDNGSYLGYAYVKYASQNSVLTGVIDNLHIDYNTNHLIFNCGTLNSSGQLTGGADQVSNAKAMLDTIKAWENAHPGRTFKVFAWLNANLTVGASNFLDVSNSTVRTNIANEAVKFTSTSSAGSFIVGASRTFDGILFDPEPSGGTSTAANDQFNNLKATMIAIKGSIGSSKINGFAAHKYSATSSSVWYWSPVFYYYMARNVDLIAAMTYNSGCTTTAAYQSWMSSQTYDILRAVSGKYWTSNHPAPTNGVKVMFGFPAYPQNLPSHDITVETTQFAALGVTAGLSALDTISKSYFLSGAVYLTSNGSGSDGYASWAVDWNNLVLYW